MPLAASAVSLDTSAPVNGRVAPASPLDDDRSEFLPVTTLRQQYLDYIGRKVEEIEEQKNARRYYHGNQWSAGAIKILRDRHQPPITFNRVGRKINGIVGLLERLRQDPKAFPRNPRHEEGAEIATSTLRYVLDANDWKTKSSEVARHAGIDGIGGVELKLRPGDKGDPDVELSIIFGDDFFYDPRSYRYDFHDARFMGLAKWLDEDEAIELFPDKEEEIRDLIENGSDLSTYSDRETKWVMRTTTQKRIRLVEHWYKHRGKWHWAFFISHTLLDEGVSPFLNERNETIPRFIMFSAAVDQDGDRYGFVRNLQGPQDEINQRRARALWISNSKRLIMEKGAVDDVETTRREWARPDGVIEKNPGKEVAPDNTQPDLTAQLGFLQDAKSEIDSAAPAQPIMPGSEQMPRNTSGRAINLLQQAGTAELGPFILAYRGWKIRVYRAIWSLCQRYWTAERWIRVTDDQQMAQFIQLNGLELDEFGRPQLVNFIGQVDVDIVLDEGPDVVNMMADTFDVLSTLPPGSVPPAVLIELSPIQGSLKQRILQQLQTPPDPIAQAMKIAALERTRAETNEKNSGSLQRIATAADKASHAHLNANEVYARGVQAASVVPAQQSSPVPPLPTGPQPTPPQAAPPMPQQPLPHPFLRGAQQAPDGRHYLPDPSRPGKYLMVA